MNSESMWIAGTGILHQPKTCRIISKYFTLRPHLQGQYSATIRRNHIIVPPINNLLSSSEMTMFNFTLNDQLIQLDHINRILNETGSADTADIDLLQRKLSEIKIRPHSHHSSTTTTESNHLFTSLIIIITVIVSVILYTCGLQHPCIRNCVMPLARVRTVVLRSCLLYTSRCV